jgi:GxxExxY protein
METTSTSNTTGSPVEGPVGGVWATTVPEAVAMVWAALGPGRPELAYSAALAIETGGDHQAPVPVRYRGALVSTCRADVFITAPVSTVIEVKVGDRATPEALAQADAYRRSLAATTAVVVAFPRAAGKQPAVVYCE